MKLGIVIPWFGRELKGGAEQHAWQIASRLAARRHTVEVLTTCCKSHQDDWETNHLPAGVISEPEGFKVRRFPVAKRDRASFNRVCAHLQEIDPRNLKSGVPPVPETDSAIFANELIKSPALSEFLAEHQPDYDRFILLPYLYGPVLDAIRIVGRRGALLPCLHDESYAYLPDVAAAIYAVGSLLFLSEGEQELAYRLFGPGIIPKSTFVGAGVEASPISADKTNGEHPDKYVLYLGRKDPGKNTPLLLRAFSRFRAVRPNSSLGLVLAGPGQAMKPAAPNIIDAGVISNETKESLLRHCAALVQPSQNESFSRVMMEAWFHGKPVAVHRRCDATAIPVTNAEGGWLADSEDEWANFFVELDRASRVKLRELGENGRRYAAVAADWENVMDRFEAALVAPEINSPRSVSPENSGLGVINQFLPNLSYGDAISNQAIWIRNELRRGGFDSEIYVQFIDPRVSHECHVFTPDAVHTSGAAIYHHSIGAEMTPHLIEFRGPKYLIYHNITPGEFFEKYRPAFADILYRGRKDLARLAHCFENSAGVSAFNAAEMAQNGFKNPGVLPLPVDPQKWALSPDPAIMEEMQDGRTNILFVGRFAPNKKQDDLVVAFSHYLQQDPGGRLILVGKPEQADPYVTHLKELIAGLGLAESVHLPGIIGDAELAAYYRTAHLFWSMSEHEGFCVPLIEAMWFDVPILAFKAAAVPETLGGAGFMFSEKDDPAGLAACARLLITDPTLRAKLIRAQRQRRLDFLPGAVLPAMKEMIDNLVGAGPVGSRRFGD
jgi:glycosyltransferase involved in cell wall biosynthesis